MLGGIFPRCPGFRFAHIPSMTNEELEIRFSRLVKTERKITVEILQMINEAERRRHYLELGFANSFNWLTRGHHYSEPAANRRIQSARLLAAVPKLEKLLSSGECNLTSAALLQSTLSKVELKTGKVFTKEQKFAWIEKIRNKTSEEAQKLLAGEFPLAYRREIIRQISTEESRLSLNLNTQELSNLKRARELLSHALKQPSWSQVIGYLANDYLKRKDPLHKKSVTAKHRVKFRANGQ